MIGFCILLLVLLLPVLLIGAAVGAQSASGPTRKLLGGILLAVGILIMTGSGLCSAAMLFSGGGFTSDPSGLVLVALVGGFPFAGGAGLFAWGRSLVRSARPASDSELRRRFD